MGTCCHIRVSATSVQYLVFEDDRPAKVFLDAGKPGSSIQAMARDGAVVVSIALQHGVLLEVMRRAITRLDDGSAAGPLGKLLDMIDSEETDRCLNTSPSRTSPHPS